MMALMDLEDFAQKNVEEHLLLKVSILVANLIKYGIANGVD